MHGAFITFRRWVLFSFLVFVVASLTGCMTESDHVDSQTNSVTKEPLPYVYSTPQAARPGSPSLVVVPVVDHRAGKDDMDEVLGLPACLDPVISKDLAVSGLFSRVELESQSPGDHDYVLLCTLNELQWDVPNYKKITTTDQVLTALVGVGELFYADSKTDVIGYSNMRFIVSKKQQPGVLLDKEYSATVTERKKKFECDTPATCREVAAEAFRKVMDQFKGDLAKELSADSK